MAASFNERKGALPADGEQTTALAREDLGPATAAEPAPTDFDEVTHGSALRALSLRVTETHELDLPSGVPANVRQEPSMWNGDGTEGATQLSDVSSQVAMEASEDESDPEPPDESERPPTWKERLEPLTASLKDSAGDLLHKAGPRGLFLGAAGAVVIAASMMWAGHQSARHDTPTSSMPPVAQVQAPPPEHAMRPMGHAAVHGRIKAHKRHHHR